MRNQSYPLNFSQLLSTSRPELDSGSGSTSLNFYCLSRRPLSPRRFFSGFLGAQRWQGLEPLPAFAIEAATESCNLMRNLPGLFRYQLLSTPLNFYCLSRRPRCPQRFFSGFLGAQRWQGLEPLPAFVIEAATESCNLMRNLPGLFRYQLLSTSRRKSGSTPLNFYCLSRRPLSPRRFFSGFLGAQRWQGLEPLPAFAIEAATESCNLMRNLPGLFRYQLL